MVVNPQELRAITDLGIHEHKPDVRVFESSVYLYFTVHGQSTTLLAHVPFTPSCFIVCVSILSQSRPVTSELEEDVIQPHTAS